MEKITGRVNDLVKKYSNHEIDEEGFKQELREILDDHPHPGNIGRALNKHKETPWVSDQARAEDVFQLANEVEPKIEEQFQEWCEVWGVEREGSESPQQ